jgi:hypothetical protein
MSGADRVTTEDDKATALAHVIHRGWCDLAESCSYGVDDLTEAERILSALAAEGYSVVKTEWEYALRLHINPALMGDTRALNVDKLAALIREVDGKHDLGAAALAESLIERGALLPADAPEFGTVSDDYNEWARCRADCELEVVRIGKVQCERCEFRDGLSLEEFEQRGDLNG